MKVNIELERLDKPMDSDVDDGLWTYNFYVDGNRKSTSGLFSYTLPAVKGMICEKLDGIYAKETDKLPHGFVYNRDWRAIPGVDTVWCREVDMDSEDSDEWILDFRTDLPDGMYETVHKWFFSWESGNLKTEERRSMGVVVQSGMFIPVTVAAAMVPLNDGHHVFVEALRLTDEKPRTDACIGVLEVSMGS